MVLEAFPNTSTGVDDSVKEGHFYGTGELFRISSKLKGGVVVAIRGDTGNSKLNDWEENSITIPLKEVERLIRGLQDIVQGLHKQAELMK